MSEPAALEWSADNCTIGRALEVIGDRWSLLVLREVFQGIRRFDQLTVRTAIPRQMLTDRLERLVADGLLRREPYQEPGTAPPSRVPADRQGHRPLPGAACPAGVGRGLPGRPRGPAGRVRASRLRGAGRAGAALPVPGTSWRAIEPSPAASGRARGAVPIPTAASCPQPRLISHGQGQMITEP